MPQAVPTRIVHATRLALGLAAALALPACCNIGLACCNIDQITTESLPDATVGRLYSFTLTHNCSDSGNTEGASWELMDGALPPGLTLSFDGSLLGTPTANGSFFFRVRLRVTNRSYGGTTFDIGSVSRAYTLTVRP